MRKILLFAAAALLLVSCGNENDNVVKIGIIGPLTGTGATTSEYWVNGLNYAIAQINGESDGETYELVIEDCQSDPAQAVACFKRLETQGVKYILAVGGQFSMAVAPLTKGKEMLFFTTADFNEAILNETDCGFRIYPNSSTFADTAINFLDRTYRYTNYATFALNSVACLEATKAFVRGVERIGGNTVFQETYDIGAYDFKNTVNKISNKKAQAIFMTGFGISPSAFINQLASNKTFDTIVLFGDLNIATKSFIDNNKNGKARIHFADCRFDEEQETAYEKKYGSHSNAIVTSSYIIPFLIKEARANTNGKGISEQLKYLRGNTISTNVGDVQLDEKGNCMMPMQVYSL